MHQPQVRAPTDSDVGEALALFDADQLPGCVHAMPHELLEALLKVVGSGGRRRAAVPLRAAAARCLANAVRCLAAEERAKARSASAAVAGGQPDYCDGELRRTAEAAREVCAASVSSPLPASLEELLLDPTLLSTLYDCISQRQAADVRTKAARLLVALVDVEGARLEVPEPGSPVDLDASLRRPEVEAFPESLRSAAVSLRAQLANSVDWRKLLRQLCESAEAVPSSYGLMALQQLLLDSASRLPLLANKAKALAWVNAVATRASTCEHRGVIKYALMDLAAVLSDAERCGFCASSDPAAAAGNPLMAAVNKAVAAREAVVQLLLSALDALPDDLAGASSAKARAAAANQLTWALVLAQSVGETYGAQAAAAAAAGGRAPKLSQAGAQLVASLQELSVSDVDEALQARACSALQAFASAGSATTDRASN